MVASSLARPALIALLAVAGCGDPPVGGTAASSSESGATSSTGDTLVPTSTEDPSGASTTTPVPTSGGCLDGAAQCFSVDQRQVCIDGTWYMQSCPEGQGCDPDAESTCQFCSCADQAQGCIDDDTIDACACLEFAPTDCPQSTACADLDGVIACHPIVCDPGKTACDTADVAKTCNPTGTAWLTTDCPTTELCDEYTGACMDACAVVAKNESSLGCDFWAVDMPNIPPRNNYPYAVALSNPSFKAAAHIKVYDRNNNGAEQQVASGTIDPRKAKVFNIAGFRDGVQGFYDVDAGFLQTGIARGRAFRIVSDVPIVATQFNPVGAGDEVFSTDASLLLPTHTLGKSYYHLAWDVGFGVGSTMIIVATADNTIVTVTASVSTPAGVNNMPALTAGVPKQLPPLDRYDYVQVAVKDLDLSSTKITATAEVAVFGGHSCARVPNANVGDCDHVEEQIFPIDTWGRHFVAGRAAPRGAEDMTWRVLAAKSGTTVSFSPEVSIGDKVDLTAGEFAEFTAEGDFEVNANPGHPVLVAGYIHGCEDPGIGGPICLGDPSMTLVVPVEQWVSDYVFLVDLSYTNNSVKLVRPAGESVSLGCLGAVSDWKTITPAYESAVVTFNAEPCLPGTNSATSALPFGIMVVGESELTSYAYPGGLQLKAINPQ